MEGQIVQKTFTVDNSNFDCWVIKIDHKFWFRAHDIAVFLGYKKPDKAVWKHIPTHALQRWSELQPHLEEKVVVPPDWKPHTPFISEGGLYRLLCRGPKPEAIRFEKWVFDDVLPNLRETGTYTLKQQVRLLTEDVQKLDLLNAELRERVAVMTNNDETKHVFRFYKGRNNPDKYLFVRTQNKYLQTATKNVDLEQYELLLDEVNVPNAMNILNRVKEKLDEQRISFKASNNKLITEANVLNITQQVLQEPHENSF
jgi:prophage antirepressor-like protein